MENAVKKVDSLPFKLGAVVMTAGVSALMRDENLQLIPLLRRHAHCDWGDLEDEDKVENDEAVLYGRRILSSYNLAGFSEPKLWVITEADRSVTTFLLPSEY